LLINLAGPLLAFLAGFYYLGLTLDRLLRSRKQIRFPVPVVSIGNLTVGGTGKTPLLIKLTRDLERWGWKPAILTRGYRGIGRSSGEKANDEALLMKRYLPDVPIGIGRDRVRVGKELLFSESPDFFLLDDGFQHWSVSRDLDIVCVDATNPFGGGHLLPWGRLREPVGALKRAQVVVITRTELADEERLIELKGQLMNYLEGGTVLVSRFQTELYFWEGKKAEEKNILAGKNIIALSAIGNPESFEKTLSRYGAKIYPCRFLDHHNYREGDLKKAIEISKARSASVVTTEKDQVKLQNLIQLMPAEFQKLKKFFVLKAELKFTDGDEKNWEKILKGKFRR